MIKPLFQSIHLEKLSKAHALSTFAWLDDPVLRELFFLRGAVDWSTHSAYFDRVLSDKSQCLFAIMRGTDHVGNCGLKHIDPIKGTAELWLYIGPSELRGQGIGAKALELLLVEGFRDLAINMIYLHVAKANEGACHLYEVHGFVKAERVASEWQAHSSTVVCMTLQRPTV